MQRWGSGPDIVVCAHADVACHGAHFQAFAFRAVSLYDPCEALAEILSFAPDGSTVALNSGLEPPEPCDVGSVSHMITHRGGRAVASGPCVHCGTPIRAGTPQTTFSWTCGVPTPAAARAATGVRGM
jgi:hypothetical protein